MTLSGTNIQFLYLICGAKYGGFSSVQVYPKSYCIQHKTKRYSFHSCRLMFIFCQHRQHSCHMAFSLLESMHGIISPSSSLSSCCISHKTKAVQFSPIPLDVYFFQRRRHDCRRAFSLLESVHRIAPPVQTIPTLQAYSESCYIHEKQSGTVFAHTA